MNRYNLKFIKLIKAAKDDNELLSIINRIYEDGYYDGDQSIDGE